MHVKMLEKREIELASGAKNIKEAGWEGEVSDDIAKEWIEDGAAQSLEVSGDNVAFTPDERAALKHVAAEVLQNAAQNELTLDDLDFAGLVEVARNSGFTGSVDVGEDELRTALAAHFEALENELVEDATEEPVDPATDELQLADLSYDELVELAQKAGIKKPRSIKKPELLALLSEKTADNSAPAAATNTETDSEAAE